MHVAKIKEVIENKEVDEYLEEWDGRETFEQLIRRNSLRKKCKECDFEGTNNARLNYHMLKEHVYQCDVCKRIIAVIDKYKSNKLLHKDSNQPLSYAQVMFLLQKDRTLILNGPETPKRES